MFIVYTPYSGQVVNIQLLQGMKIVLDPGHGGEDCGAKYGNLHEADLNLKISFALKEELESRGATVYLTRTDDQDMTRRNYNYSKADDMYLRAIQIDKYEPDLFLSIHLNSSSSSAWGSQVFYFEGSEEGKRLGETLQSFLVEYLDKENHRLAKGNTSYYLLKKTEVPLAIAECGFLSNGEEAALLVTEEYQEKVAEAICEGILAYLAEKEAEIL